MTDAPDDYRHLRDYTIREAAEAIGIYRDTLRKMIKLGLVKNVRIHEGPQRRRVYIRPEEVERLRGREINRGMAIQISQSSQSAMDKVLERLRALPRD